MSNCKACGKSVNILFKNGTFCRDCYTKLLINKVEWVKCPKCGKYVNALTEDKICYDCRENWKRAVIIKEVEEKHQQEQREAKQSKLGSKIKTFIEASLPKGDTE